MGADIPAPLQPRERRRRRRGALVPCPVSARRAMSGLEEDPEFDFDFLFEFNQSNEAAGGKGW